MVITCNIWVNPVYIPITSPMPPASLAAAAPALRGRNGHAPATGPGHRKKQLGDKNKWDTSQLFHLFMVRPSIFRGLEPRFFMLQSLQSL